MPVGYVALVLHAHLPYVLGYGRWPHGAEWLYEAACETYIPLLNVLSRLWRKGKGAGITLGLTPILCEMLASSVFKRELKDYIRERIRAAREDEVRLSEEGGGERAGLAGRWALFYEAALHDFEVAYEEDLLRAFKALQDRGWIEIIASSATHAYLPLIGTDSCVSAQVRQGIERYEFFFGRRPAGMWLPECGYRPATFLGPPAPPDSRSGYRKGIEEILAENGIDYFFLDTHLLAGGRPLDDSMVALLEGLDLPKKAGLSWDPSDGEDCYCSSPIPAQGPQGVTESFTVCERHGGSGADPLAPHFAGSPFSKQVCTVFAREQSLSMQVWSRDRGYPGDGAYLEFHKRDPRSGLRYWRVTDRTGGLDGKEIYGPREAALKVEAHGAHFVSSVSSILRSYYEMTGQAGVLTVAFDAELFGHWWFEGMRWLETVAGLLGSGDSFELASPAAILKSVRPRQTLVLPEGSWGKGGDHGMWYNRETAWMWQSMGKAERAFCEALGGRRRVTPLSERLLRQMGRELFLLQASDWQFLVTTGTAREYAESRFRGHEESFWWLHERVRRSSEDGVLSPEDLEMLEAVERMDPVFDSINLSWFEERTENGL